MLLAEITNNKRCKNRERCTAPSLSLRFSAGHISDSLTMFGSRALALARSPPRGVGRPLVSWANLSFLAGVLSGGGIENVSARTSRLV